MQPIIVYTAGTPNGQKVSNFTEELKEVYPDFKVDYRAISFDKNEQKEPWFLKINPNGRIPAIVDPNRGDFAVFETSAILLYLEKHYDPEHKFSWPSSDAKADDLRSEVLQWMFFGHGGIGPMQGQANHFARYAPEEIPYAIDRYKTETKRLYSVLGDRLQQSGDYLVGNKYTLADVSIWPWVFIARHSGIPDENVPENVKAWVKRCFERPASQRGMHVPSENKAVAKMIDPEYWQKYGGEHKERNAPSWILSGMKADAEKHK
ncbi:Glutathione S-transferase 2 [Tilletia horrida]|nr:Glutathione S-transferase 2 [Tilletia horrida]